MIYYLDLCSCIIFIGENKMVLEPEKENMAVQHKTRKSLALFLLLSFAVCGSFCFSSQSPCNNFLLLRAEISGHPVLSTQNCENPNSAYRGNQLQLLQNIFRSIRFNHFTVIAKDADIITQFISELSVSQHAPARGFFTYIQDFSLKICLRSSLPVRAGPAV